MSVVDNTNKRLIEGIVVLLRDKVDGWSTSSEFDVPNVWSTGVPDSVTEEFPRGAVDIFAANDFDLSVELDVQLREAFVRVVVFSENSSDAENLRDDSEEAIVEHWDSVAENPKPDWEIDEYSGNWTFRQLEGMTQLNEDEGAENKLRYNRSTELVFETVKTN